MKKRYEAKEMCKIFLCLCLPPEAGGLICMYKEVGKGKDSSTPLTKKNYEIFYLFFFKNTIL